MRNALGLASASRLGHLHPRPPSPPVGPPPGAPSGLSAGAAGANAANLVWTASQTGQVDNYILERSPDGSTGWAVVATPTGTSYSDAGLAPSTTYFYRVKAHNSGGDSAYSNTASATTSAASGGARSLINPATDLAHKGMLRIAADGGTATADGPGQVGWSSGTCAIRYVGGERRLLTVLFCSYDGSTTTSRKWGDLVEYALPTSGYYTTDSNAAAAPALVERRRWAGWDLVREYPEWRDAASGTQMGALYWDEARGVLWYTAYGYYYGHNMPFLGAVQLLDTPGHTPPPVTAKVRTATTGGTISTGTYYFVLTYTGAGGTETTPSLQFSITTTTNTSTITIPKPTTLSGATGWRCYGGTTNGSGWTLQGGTNALTTSLVLTAPPSTGGAAPPGSNTLMAGGLYAEVGTRSGPWDYRSNSLSNTTDLSWKSAYSGIIPIPAYAQTDCGGKFAFFGQPGSVATAGHWGPGLGATPDLPATTDPPHTVIPQLRRLVDYSPDAVPTVGGGPNRFCPRPTDYNCVLPASPPPGFPPAYAFTQPGSGIFDPAGPRGYWCSTQDLSNGYVWVDTGTRHGILLFGRTVHGHTWYGNNPVGPPPGTPNFQEAYTDDGGTYTDPTQPASLAHAQYSDGWSAALRVYDPAQVMEAGRGARSPYSDGMGPVNTVDWKALFPKVPTSQEPYGGTVLGRIIYQYVSQTACWDAAAGEIIWIQPFSTAQALPSVQFFSVAP